MRRLASCVLGTIGGYVLGAVAGYSLVSRSSNMHDRPIEAAMTGAFVAGPLGAVVGGVAGFVLGGERATSPDMMRRDDRGVPLRCGVAEAIQAGPGATRSNPRQCGCDLVDLAIDRLLTALTVGGDPGIDRGTHRFPPPYDLSEGRVSARRRAGCGTPARLARGRTGSGR